MDSVFPTSTSDSAGTYDMTVAAPEPASLGILGAGLFGLGYIRRRNARRV